MNKSVKTALKIFAVLALIRGVGGGIYILPVVVMFHGFRQQMLGLSS